MNDTVIIRYNAGNVKSVALALERIGVSSCISDNPEIIRSAKRVIFPGQGEAKSAMEYLRARALDTVITSLAVPVLGICLGHQLLCSYSEENETDCFGIIPATVRKFTKARKIPHMGWSKVHYDHHPLFSGIPQDSYLYFVHSYFIPGGAYSIAEATYEEPFCAALQIRNYLGVQFHPEKSGLVGEKILENFIRG